MDLPSRIKRYYLVAGLFAILSSTFGFSLFAGEASPPQATIKPLQKGAAVKPFGKTIFNFYTNYGPLSARARATFMERKMLALATTGLLNERLFLSCKPVSTIFMSLTR